ncbi:mannosyl-glycoprotein endo-beta-N-acetylglucosamidase [Alteromonas sediminis]|uniref:Mannosyl-glycoprotein endo-beta-N-acetylglucosamidase n=1 Tax=Alteromonas sediminis TaxID=2259342 RepID=A0A3N5Y272_9ALTE|nr:glucosaminidase domain-containing protein [Alteromonas sediminis]RPJ67410.1 mannosyl-glycoprotein endo-beta-N-acetylglucosamidase [Alteromonas sediminis]
MATRRSVIKVSLSTLIALVLVLYLWSLSTERVQQDLVPAPSEMAAKPVPDFTDFANVEEKKKAFFDYLRPEIEAQNQHILGIRHRLMQLQRKVANNEPLSEKERQSLVWLKKEYRVDSNVNPQDLAQTANVIQGLLNRIDIIPTDLVLVQAANESAWGTSRFARRGYNFFGLWCFKKGCGFVPSRRKEDAKHEVAKFPNLTRAVYTYLRNLNRHDAYRELRQIRANLRANNLPITGSDLAEGLVSYSERGHDYVEELQAMIRFNEEYFTE